MDKRESISRLMALDLIKGLHFCLPCFVLSFDPVKQRAQVQPAIDRVDVSGWTENLPALIDVPVMFIGGSGFHIEHQVNRGDEGLLKFSQRCVDMWKLNGGTVVNTDGRILNIQDGFLELGYRSNPNVITGFSNNGIKIRDKSGAHYHWLKNDGTSEISNGNGKITMLADGTVNINGVIISPDGTVNGPTSVTAPLVHGSEDVTFAGVSGKGHRHGGVESGNQTSGVPV